MLCEFDVYLWDEFGQVALTKKPDKYYSYLHDAHKRIQFELEKESIRGRGDITAIYDINAYGKILSESGTPQTPFRYAGYYYDTETGLYYLKNRYYNGYSTRFLTEDPY